MCRFVIYKSHEPIIISTLLSDPKNSLICQSRLAKEMKCTLNADGFGLGWYDHRIDDKPGLFKSTQPAWNDENLLNIASKLKSDCFLGHVRSSTIGDVNTANCHPFCYENLLFCHNGTINGFDQIKRDLLLKLDEDLFAKIKGQTDSEHFFFLICHFLKKTTKKGAQALEKAFCDAINALNSLLDHHHLEYDYKINAVLTDGKAVCALRYTSNPNCPPHSLYYLLNPKESVIIASEYLSDKPEEWEQIPVNSVITVEDNLTVTINPVTNYATKRGVK